MTHEMAELDRAHWRTIAERDKLRRRLTDTQGVAFFWAMAAIVLACLLVLS